MAATVTGSVDALKRLFERDGNDSGSFNNNKNDTIFNGTSRSSNANNNFMKNAPSLNGSLRPSSPSSEISSSRFSNVSEQNSANNNSSELARTKPPPPKVKPKPAMYRKILPSVKNETPSQSGMNVFSSDSGSSLTGNEPAKSGWSYMNDGGSKATGLPKQENGIGSTLPPISNTIRSSSSKKPPPVAKKPRSILSGYSNRSSRSHSKYDEELEKQFGMKVDASSYDYVERWASKQARSQQEMINNKSRRNEDESPTNEGPMQKSGTPSISSSTGRSGSNFTNSSIRSILKKGRPSLGVEKKTLTFKEGKELITKYSYPSEDSYTDDADIDSLDRHRSALDSDSGSSSSTFDEDTLEFEPESTGTQRNRGKVIIASSNASNFSSSTLKGSIDHHGDYSSRSKGSRNEGKSNGFMEPRTHSHSKGSSAFKTSPVILTPTKNDTLKRFTNSPVRFHY
ncbi:hypothetical protein Aperf_G00000102857 [Anoplocephala perfoliata]